VGECKTVIGHHPVQPAHTHLSLKPILDVLGLVFDGFEELGKYRGNVEIHSDWVT
jgi:hypothetical protein